MRNGPRTGIVLLLGFLILASAAATLADTIRLKNGREIHGQVVSFGNGEFIVLVTPSGGQADYRDRRILLVESVESIEFDAAGTAAAAGPSEELIVLDASQEVVATGVQVRRGDRVHITASGQMQFADGRVSGPAGLDSRETWPFPGERFGVLIAVVGDPQSSSIYYVIGEEDEFEARSDGEVFLQINARSLQGARGAYTARMGAPGAAGDPTGSPATSAPAPGPTVRHEREIPANKDWTDTGIDIMSGDTIRFSVEGTIHYTSSRTCGPDGARRDLKDLFRALPVNDVGRGAFIGLIGQAGVATPFFIGSQGEFKVEKTGRLFLGVNDDNYDNNSGSFRAQIEIIPGGR
jgi:hypothetical protein